MKNILIIILFLAGSSAFAQTTAAQNAQSKLQAARIALITERLGLTPSQAEKFWPIYHEYAEQRGTIQQEYRKARLGVDMNKLTEEQSRKLLKAQMDGKQRQLNLETKYGDRLMDVINTRQLMALKKQGLLLHKNGLYYQLFWHPVWCLLIVRP